MKDKGTDVTIARYISESEKLAPQNEKLNSALLEAALQLIKYSWNEHNDGSSWDYWFSKPKGYDIKQYQDSKLTSAETLLAYLSAHENKDAKLRNFMYEISGFINLLQGNTIIGKDLYLKSISNPDEAYPVTLTRGNEIMKRLNK
uniref:Uncharacterized protein n=2 Tax=Chryseobacterium TaxID=59732 RepID=A0AAU6WUB1_9FLAO